MRDLMKALNDAPPGGTVVLVSHGEPDKPGEIFLNPDPAAPSAPPHWQPDPNSPNRLPPDSQKGKTLIVEQCFFGNGNTPGSPTNFENWSQYLGGANIIGWEGVWYSTDDGTKDGNLGRYPSGKKHQFPPPEAP